MTPPSRDGDENDEVGGSGDSDPLGDRTTDDEATTSDGDRTSTGDEPIAEDDQGSQSDGKPKSQETVSESRDGVSETDRLAGEDATRDRQQFRTQRDDPPPTATADAGGTERDPLLKELTISILAVLLVGIYIFMVSGVWPPMVAVESGSMEPNMNVNDLVFVMDSDRFQPSEAQGETGVVTARTGEETGYEQFGGHGDVIVFNPNGDEQRTPIIHRAMFWVEEGERWVERADPEYLGGADSCSDLSTCPAPNDGFITKGDNNPSYDQAGGGQFRVGPNSGGAFRPVQSEWVVGTAEIRVPRIGWLRLRFQ